MPVFMPDPDLEPQPLEPWPDPPADTPPEPDFDPVQPDTAVEA
jgi:hypothetical protein